MSEVQSGLSRRQLLGGLFRREPTPEPAVASPPAPTRHGHGLFPVIRPPGAVEEPLFLDRCTKCNECVDACAPKAITHAPARFRRAAGTPMIDPAAAPCLMCEGLPCIPACPEGALQLSALRPIATARLLDYNCLAYQGSFCSVCSEQCPEPGAIVTQMGKPEIVNEPCTGCGICHHACPAPTNAIAMMPPELGSAR